MVVDLRVEIALHDILFVVPIVCACPAAWGVGNLHQTAAVEDSVTHALAPALGSLLSNQRGSNPGHIYTGAKY